MRVVVTGAFGAVGSAVADGFLARGASVFAVGRHVPERRVNDLVTTVNVDVSKPDALRQLQAVLGDVRLDAVIAAHGVAGARDLHDVTAEFVHEVLTINAHSVPLVYEALKRNLRGGSFVVVASQAGLVAEPGNVTYSAAKFAAVAWVKEMSRTARDGVAIRVLCPGRIDSPMMRDAEAAIAGAAGISPVKRLMDIEDQIPVGRFATPGEIADVALYLAESGSARPTVLAVTGGDVLY